MSDPKDKAPAGANGSGLKTALRGDSSAAQRGRMLHRLRERPASTIEARRDLDVMAPAARVHELRHRFGYAIETVWIEQATECGKVHRVALYVLRGGAAGEQ